MPFSAINFLTDRRKTKPEAVEDEAAVIKAAAWAWYERGSGSEGKPIREFDFTNSRRTDPAPSRYKIEAMKSEKIDKYLSSACPSFNSSLMDNYEMESISKELGHYIEACDDRRRVVAVEKIEKVVGSDVKSKKLSRGFLLRHAAVSCGSINDVVAGRDKMVDNIRGRQRPEKRGPVVKSSTPPTRVTHAL